MRPTVWKGVLLATMAVAPRAAAQPCGVREYVYVGSRLLATVNNPTSSSVRVSVGLGTTTVGGVTYTCTGAHGERSNACVIVTATTSDSCPMPAFTVSYGTVATGSATPGTDFVAVAGQLTFAAQSPSGAQQVVEIPLVNDFLMEGEDTFRFDLSNASGGATIDPGSVTLTILDDDRPTIALVPAGGAQYWEGGTPPPPTGPVAARFVAAPLDPGSAAAGPWNIAVEALGYESGASFGTAVRTEDFNLVTTSVTVSTGPDQSITVNPVADTALEGNEWFTVRLSAAGVVGASLTVTILDDDTSPPLSLYTIAPCRIWDSATSPDADGLVGNLTKGQDRAVRIADAPGGQCEIPSAARAVTLTITVANATTDGHLRIHPKSSATDPASVINFAPGDTIASNGHYFLDPSGTLNIFCAQISDTAQTRVIIDVTGYFK